MTSVRRSSSPSADRNTATRGASPAPGRTKRRPVPAAPPQASAPAEDIIAAPPRPTYLHDLPNWHRVAMETVAEDGGSGPDLLDRIERVGRIKLADLRGREPGFVPVAKFLDDQGTWLTPGVVSDITERIFSADEIAPLLGPAAPAVDTPRIRSLLADVISLAREALGQSVDLFSIRRDADGRMPFEPVRMLAEDLMVALRAIELDAAEIANADQIERAPARVAVTP